MAVMLCQPGVVVAFLALQLGLGGLRVALQEAAEGVIDDLVVVGVLVRGAGEQVMEGLIGEPFL